LGASGLEPGEQGWPRVEVEPLDIERVRGASRAVMALEHQHILAVPRQEPRAAQPAETAADHDDVRLRPLHRPDRPKPTQQRGGDEEV